MSSYIDDDEGVIDVPSSVRKEIIANYLQNTYYWSVAIGGLIIGFLIGVLI